MEETVFVIDGEQHARSERRRGGWPGGRDVDSEIGKPSNDT